MAAAKVRLKFDKFLGLGMECQGSAKSAGSHGLRTSRLVVARLHPKSLIHLILKF